MPLSKQEIDALLGLICDSQADELDCGQCYEHIAEFAEAELAGHTIDEALQAVKTHIECCRCCADEYQALLEGLRSLQ